MSPTSSLKAHFFETDQGSDFATNLLLNVLKEVKSGLTFSTSRIEMAGLERSHVRYTLGYLQKEGEVELINNDHWVANLRVYQDIHVITSKGVALLGALQSGDFSQGIHFSTYMAQQIDFEDMLQVIKSDQRYH